MLGENKNLKDTSKNSLKDTPFAPISSANMPALYDAFNSNSAYYIKTNKLITALYMVTDTMEKEEPIRLRLRTLGVEILSDITVSKGAFDIQKIDQILSFLNIAFDVRMVSEMNCNILRKEFTELKQSIQESTAKNNLWFEELSKESPSPKSVSFSKGHHTRIGVQKGSTLMDALNKVGNQKSNHGHEELKNKRREEITSIVKKYPNGISIKDIMLAMRSLGEAWGEKTLQRELVSMVKDNVLKKTGEKRWSLYFLS